MFYPRFRTLLKFFAGLLAVGIAFYAILAAFALLLKPDITQSLPVYSDEVLQPVIEARQMHFDINATPPVQRDVDYSEGSRGAWYPKGESPILAELVQSGQLPPVAQRVGSEPLVMEGVDGIGNYGGTWQRIATAPRDTVVISHRIANTNLVRWSPMGYPIVPHMAKGWEHNEDYTEWTFHLRKGMRWSDGHPFTSGDILYWWKYEHNFFGTQSLIAFSAGGKQMEVEADGDYAVRFKFAAPNSSFLEEMATPRIMFSPRHYLEQYHPKLGDPQKIAEAMRQRGVNSTFALYNLLRNYRNPEHPRLWPWIYRTWRSSPPESFVRNPYYWAVDTEGNQLPYLDRVRFEQRTEQLLPITAAAGDISMQLRGLRFSDYTLLMENSQRNGYSVYQWYPATRSAWSLFPNLNRRVDPGDTIAAQKSDLLQTRDFRIALSLAINRQKIIDSIYNGVGVPAQIDPGPGSDFENPQLRAAYIEYDPQEANRLLDAIGLTTRDAEGMRTLPDGQRLSWYIDYNIFTGEGPVQFVIADWARVGIRAIPRERNYALFISQKSSLVNDFTVWTSESDFYPLSSPRSFVAATPQANQAISNARWFVHGGLYGATDMPAGIQEPPKGSAVRQTMELYEKARQALSPEERIAIFRRITDITAEEVWSISIATAPPTLVVVKDGFRNVPRHALEGYSFGTPGNTGVETYFWENPQESPGALARISREMIEIDTGRSGAASATADKGAGDWIAQTLRWALTGIIILLAVMVAVRHPYVGRRILIMIPTLLIISVVSFTIIDLPPGDYMETRVQELEASGDQTSIQEIERLREMFHLDEPLWQRYLRWMGFTWFVTFEPQDAGLLQGQMGRSMETLSTVNSMVGDRIALTFWVSLGTILFTWAIALPIGIYSAVRQYSIGDYALSLIGFLGMCIPNFLLAILLMYASDRLFGISAIGLFSPDYAAQPEWSVGKVIDLLKHIWIPVVVIATAGTAGLIRVMRGNLLDELGKPYVTTARAKGVRPFKLLMKYPVRLALNPFISGIGSLFPQLISGGAIVAIVLSLPMVGPLMLQALLSEDIYMAASMLMVLSTLGVIGTLVSDLLLLWIDPRIRMEGGSR